MKPARIAAWFICVGLFAPSVHAWQVSGKTARFSFNAPAVSYLILTGAPKTGDVGGETLGLALERLRPTLRLGVKTWLAFEAAYDLLPVVGEVGTLGFAVAGANPLRLADLDQDLATGSGWKLQHNLDRLVFRFMHPRFEIRIGRQAIGLGAALIFPAVDLFAPFGPASIDNEYRRGVDGVRVTVPVGDTMELAAFAVFKGTDFEKGVYLLRWQGNFSALDISTALGASYGLPTLTLSLAGSIGDVGWLLDSTLRVATASSEPSVFGRVTLGLSYKFDFGLTLLAESHFSSGGGATPDDYLLTTQNIEFEAGESFLMGKWYVGLSLSYAITPLITAQLVSMVNAADGSGMMMPTVSWNLSENVTIGVGGLLPFGKRSLTAIENIPIPRSEFGMYPFMFYTKVAIAM